MTVNFISRYYEVAAEDRYIARRKRSPTVRYRTYVATGYDSFDLLSHRLFGDASKWYLIADLNPHVPFPDTIPVGTELRLPVG